MGGWVGKRVDEWVGMRLELGLEKNETRVRVGKRGCVGGVWMDR